MPQVMAIDYICVVIAPCLESIVTSTFSSYRLTHETSRLWKH